MRKNHYFRITLFYIVILGGVFACTASSYGNPPRNLQESDLIGIWEVQYDNNSIDKLIIREDGTYKQQYQNMDTNYVFESGWSPFWIEKISDGRVYIHFEGARYYSSGERIAELDGMGDPCPTDTPNCISGNSPRRFYDPYGKDDVEMVKELVLTIRVDSDGNIVFHHLWTSIDRGFAIFGGQADIFRRIDDQNPSEN